AMDLQRDPPTFLPSPSLVAPGGIGGEEEGRGLQSDGTGTSMGLPWASRMWSWLELREKEGRFCVGHQASRPLLNLLTTSQNPFPSKTRILTAFRERFVKTKTVPLKGSSPRDWRQRAARPSMPRRKSAGFTASINR